jgi:hypothetical protein
MDQIAHLMVVVAVELAVSEETPTQVVVVLEDLVDLITLLVHHNFMQVEDLRQTLELAVTIQVVLVEAVLETTLLPL